MKACRNCKWIFRQEGYSPYCSKPSKEICGSVLEIWDSPPRWCPGWESWESGVIDYDSGIAVPTLTSEIKELIAIEVTRYIKNVLVKELLSETTKTKAVI